MMKLVENIRTMTWGVLVLIATTLLSNCNAPVNRSKNGLGVTDTVRIKSKESVSLIDLISNSKLYNNKSVVVTGFLEVEFESTILFLHREDYDQGLLDNAIWVQLTKEDIASSRYQKYNHKYVFLRGVFDANNAGQQGKFVGAIRKITKIGLLK